MFRKSTHLYSRITTPSGGVLPGCVLAAVVSAVGMPVGIVANHQVTAGRRTIRFNLLDRYIAAVRYTTLRERLPSGSYPHTELCLNNPWRLHLPVSILCIRKAARPLQQSWVFPRRRGLALMLHFRAIITDELLLFQSPQPSTTSHRLQPSFTCYADHDSNKSLRFPGRLSP
jgi:hypothetical protein